MMNQWSQGAFYYYCFKTFKTQNFTIKLSNHLLKVNQIKQLPVGTILSFYYFGKTVHLRFCSSRCNPGHHPTIIRWIFLSEANHRNSFHYVWVPSTIAHPTKPRAWEGHRLLNFIWNIRDMPFNWGSYVTQVFPALFQWNIQDLPFN